MARQINALGLEKIKQWEGLRLKAYKDSAGVVTIGYGHTGYVTISQEITEEQAEKILKQDLLKAENTVENLVKVPLSDNQFAALVSFQFNIGELESSTLLKELNKCNYGAVPKELMKWVKATDPKTGKKKVLEGLVNRRAAESGLWAKGAYVASNTVEAKPVTKPVVTKESVTWGAGILASLGSLFDGNGAVQYALAAVIVISFAAGAVLFVRKRI